MALFYVNTNADSKGDHEVHASTCSYLPAIENRRYLGDFVTCRSAVTEAKTLYPKSNGCFWCANACHTT